MSSTNVICFTLVLFLKQEVIKYYQIFMLRGDFFHVWDIIGRFIKITLNRLIGIFSLRRGALFLCQLMNQLVW